LPGLTCSPSSLAQATPTTFGDLRLANGHSAQRRRVNSGPPPSGLQDWLLTFQTWSGPERLLALDELIDRCETSQVKHMMQVIEPQFQRDFISLLPKELALYVLTFLAPRDLLQAAQTCRYWRILAEDNLLWREKCREEGKHCLSSCWRHVLVNLSLPDVIDRSIGSVKLTVIRLSASPQCLRTLTGHSGGVWCSQMAGATVISGSTDRTLRVWDAESGECVHALYGHTSTVRCMHLHGER
ncbi:F-box/WD repeat-containing protein 7-like, partial [Poecilia reticulata]|uniref:F-box/WD repeat-containing protein 7-like n=1 Tax=Poecilia reticulata TaxID=8081 RepID=UPI0007EAE778